MASESSKSGIPIAEGAYSMDFPNSKGGDQLLFNLQTQPSRCPRLFATSEMHPLTSLNSNGSILREKEGCPVRYAGFYDTHLIPKHSQLSAQAKKHVATDLDLRSNG